MPGPRRRDLPDALAVGLALVLLGVAAVGVAVLALVLATTGR